MFPEATFDGRRDQMRCSASRRRACCISPARLFLRDAGQRGQPTGTPGLALAGANLPQTRMSGTLTALEASGLNLWGTQLVTLGLRHRRR
jgi:hypothetical protein